MDIVELCKDCRALARYYMTLYFRHKRDAAGHPIPRETVCSERYIDLVLDHDVCAGVVKIYDLIRDYYPETQLKAPLIPKDVSDVIAMLAGCAKMGIPKEFATGIILMELELCRGLRMAA